MAREAERTYDEEAVRARLRAELPGWQLVEGTIRRTYRTASWKGALMAANAIGHLAEAAWHHPDLLITYSSVEVRLSNHAANGITDKDFELARKIDEVVLWRPQLEGGALEGTPDNPRFAYVRYEG